MWTSARWGRTFATGAARRASTFPEPSGVNATTFTTAMASSARTSRRQRRRGLRRCRPCRHHRPRPRLRRRHQGRGRCLRPTGGRARSSATGGTAASTVRIRPVCSTMASRAWCRSSSPAPTAGGAAPTLHRRPSAARSAGCWEGTASLALVRGSSARSRTYRHTKRCGCASPFTASTRGATARHRSGSTATSHGGIASGTASPAPPARAARWAMRSTMRSLRTPTCRLRTTPTASPSG